jgi:putative transposase
MPYGLKRFQKAEALHFITFSCFHRLPLLDAPDPKNTVEAVLELTRARHQARVYAYVLMARYLDFSVTTMDDRV